MAFLVLVDGRRIPVADGVKIGRADDCEVVLADSKASRHHAILRVAGTVAEIEDHGSHNGTLLNGERVRRRVLRQGDLIVIGTTEIRYEEQGVRPAERGPLLDDPYQPGGGLEGDPLPRIPAAVAPPEELDVVEFADEVVQTRKPPTPVPAVRAASRPKNEPGPRERGVLQFSRHTRRGGLLGDDMRQMPLWQRAGLVVVAIALACGLAWGVMTLVAG